MAVSCPERSVLNISANRTVGNVHRTFRTGGTQVCCLRKPKELPRSVGAGTRHDNDGALLNSADNGLLESLIKKRDKML
jgi:hypothetical protein